MKKIDRFKSLIRYCKENGIVSSQKDLGVKLGYQNESSFSQVINGKVDEPKDFTYRLCNLIPGLNKEWLLTGKGAMIYKDASAQSWEEAEDKEREKEINRLKKELSDLKEMVAQLQEDKSNLSDTVKSLSRALEAISHTNKAC